MTMTKSQKDLIENKVAGLYSAGLQLQVRLLELTKQWQGALSELVQSRWAMSLAAFTYANSDDLVLKAEAEAEAADARGRHRQAVLRYNALTGRGPDEALAFDQLNPVDVDALMAVMEKALKSQTRLTEIIASARAEMDVPQNGFNLMDWIPWVEKLTFTLGVQLQDTLSNQVIGAGASVRLPIYDPGSSAAGHALQLNSKAILIEMAQSTREIRLRARSEAQLADAWRAQAGLHAGAAQAVSDAVADGIRAYRNNLISQSELWNRFRRWRWSLGSHLEARAQAAMKAAWALMDETAADSAPYVVPRGGEAATFAEGVELAATNSLSWEALALRSQAAGELMAAADHRFNKISVDLNLGLNLTAGGIALLPAFGVTGLGMYPIFNVELNPAELQSLSKARRKGEEEMYLKLQSKVGADLALRMFQNLASYKAGQESLAIYEGQVLPELAAAQDGSAKKAFELDQARAQALALRGRQGQTLATLNYLLARPLDAPLSITSDMETALSQLASRLAAEKPLESGRDVLTSRLKVARAVEEMIDKNLKTQQIRFEPISLIGRSLGRLIAAISGDGMPSPELVALARNETLAAERDLMAYDKSLPALRARLQFEATLAERDLAALRGRADGQSRLQAAALRGRLYEIKALLLSYNGKSPEEAKETALPGSFADLKEQLQEAFSAEAPSPQVGGSGQAMVQERFFEAHGNMRYYHHRKGLDGEHIDKHYIEGWVEVRMRSASTPPEALVALANLQNEKADQLYKTELALARAKADMLLSRLQLTAGLLRVAHGDVAQTLRDKLARDFSLAAAHLGWPKAATVEQILALLPQTGADDSESAAARYLGDVATLDLELLRRTLFQEGLPEEIAAAADPLPQLRSNLIAEKMSYKGFTPMGAFGYFRNTWVGGVFLEAPDPERIQRGLENILTDGLRRELESQERLKTLALKLHSLMASVADKVISVNAQRTRLAIARRNLSGMAVRMKMGLAEQKDVQAAAAESEAAHEDFVSTLYALRMDFVQLVTELQALGYPAIPSMEPTKLTLKGLPETSERSDRDELLAFWSKRLLDEGFEARQDGLMPSVPPSLRAELRQRLLNYRQSQKDHDGVLHVDFTERERLDLLMRNDLQGRRHKVEQTLGKILDELRKGDPSGGWTGLMTFLREDVEAQAVSAKGDYDAGARMTGAVREAYWNAAAAPPAVQKAYSELTTLAAATAQAKQEALSHYLQQKTTPQEYLLKDAALDEYVKALIAYDEAMVRVFGSDAVAKDPRWARALDGLFGLRDSLARRRDLLKYGRGIMSIDASMELGATRLQAMKWRNEDPRELQPAAETLAALKAMRRRWTGDPDAIESLLAIKGADPKERTEWVTEKGLAELESKGSMVVEFDNKRWLVPATWVGKRPETRKELDEVGAREIVAGSDVKRDRLSAAMAQAEQGARRAQNTEALKRSEAVLTTDFDGGAGRYEAPLSLAELRRKEREGKVLYFAAAYDQRTGLRLSVHPLTARWMSPAQLLVLVQVDGAALPSGRYGSYEALKQSKADFARFQRVEFGALGGAALLEEAKAQELLSRRRGWLSLKLEGFAYARDGEEILAVYMDEDELAKALEQAKNEKHPSHKWDFQRVSDLRLGLDEHNDLVAVEGRGFKATLRAKPALSWITGELYALELDENARVIYSWLDSDALERESAAWWLRDTTGQLWTQTQFEMSPIARLRCYVDPRTGKPIALGRAYLAKRSKGADKGLGAAGRWAYMPWNWGNIIMETPRGIIKTPIEMITGRDPNQEGYIGRVYMYQTDGGATEHRGILGTIARAIDIFEILPDHVDRYMDPSQFPDKVNNDSPILPGQWQHEKKTTTTDGEKNIHFGKGSLLREVRYAKEDQEDARARVMGSFQGGVSRTFIETVRGRGPDYKGGLYKETKVDRAVGGGAVEETLKMVGDRTDSEGKANFSKMPEHLAVDKVEASIEIQLGAEQQARRQRIYQDYIDGLGKAVAPRTPDDAEIVAARLELELADSARQALRAAYEAAKPMPSLPGNPTVPQLFHVATNGR